MMHDPVNATLAIEKRPFCRSDVTMECAGKLRANYYQTRCMLGTLEILLAGISLTCTRLDGKSGLNSQKHCIDDFNAPYILRLLLTTGDFGRHQ